ncbi:MAG: PilZ domain-containing protein [Phycisphaerae bacterium]
MQSAEQERKVGGHPEIARLLRAVGKGGANDIYAGKRRKPRVADRIQLEITTDLTKPALSCAVTMQDVSEGGVSFWSRRDLEPGDVAYIREFSSDNRCSWIRVRVRHRTAGLRGYLVGACFDKDETSKPGAASSTQRAGPAAPPQMLPPGWRTPRPR